MSRRGADGHRRLVTAVLAVLVVTIAVPIPAAGVTEPAHETGESEVATRTANALTFTHTFERLPDQPGTVRVTVATEAPKSVTGVSVSPPEDAAVVETTGYEQTSDEEWTWDRSESSVDQPTITYVVGVDRSDEGTLEATSTGEWALFNWHTADIEWSYARSADAPEPAVVERGEPAGEGVVGPGYAYLGPYETETRTVDGERIRLVVPRAAEMEASPDAVADALAGASADLRVGARNEQLTVFVAPEPIDAAGRLSRAEVDGKQDMYVGADQPLDTADNAWFHEYVHSRQSYDAGPGMQWFDDASAEYYAALLAYRSGHISEDAFFEYVRTDEGRDAVLTESESVEDDASYFKGMRVLAALDAEVRNASNDRSTLQDVFAGMNAHDGTVDDETFATLVEEAAGEPRDEWLDTYVGTDASPTVPDYLGEQSMTERPATEERQRELGSAPLIGVVCFVGALVVFAGTVRSRRN